MAKKSAAKRTGTPQPRGPKAVPTPRTVKLEQQELIPQVRHTVLDGLCESIGKCIDRRNKIARDEESDKQVALDYMVENHINAYHHAGTELVLRPGATLLMARKHREVSAITTPANLPSTMPGDQPL